ncbi:MAG: DUF5118 domain-containing protein [Candidatus Omnitrophota bacterium]
MMMKFLEEVCGVPKAKIKGRINIHPHLNIKQAKKFWLGITEIPKNNLNRPLLVVSRASRQKRDTLPLGTFNIIVGDVILASKIKGWIKGLSEWAVGAVG